MGHAIAATRRSEHHTSSQVITERLFGTGRKKWARNDLGRNGESGIDQVGPRITTL